MGVIPILDELALNLQFPFLYCGQKAALENMKKKTSSCITV